MNKRGLSPVIATVMIIMITIVAAGIIASFVIPFVQNSLGEGKECFEVLGDISFAETPYNCYYNSTITGVGQSSSALSVKIDGEKIAGLSLVIGSDGNSDSFKINENSALASVRMLNGNYNENLAVPKDGGVRTYVVNQIYKTAELYPMLESGKVCDAADTIEIKPCTDPNTINQLSSYVSP